MKKQKHKENQTKTEHKHDRNNLVYKKNINIKKKITATPLKSRITQSITKEISLDTQCV